MKNAFLIGESIYLRPLEAADAPTLVRWMNDWDVIRTLQSYRPLNEQAEREFIERVTTNPNEIGFGIVSRRDERFIGTAGLMQIDWRARHAGFGISIGDKSSWGRGYGTEATRLVTGYAFEVLNLNRVWLHVYDYNPAGIRAYERAGYRREGVLRQGAYREGAYHDVIVMAILREEWQAASPKPRRSGVAARASTRPLRRPRVASRAGARPSTRKARPAR